VVQVLNGTHTNGLAGEISTRLEAAGYTLKTAANYGTAQTTTIYYQPAHKIDAAYLQKKQFPDAALAPALKSQPKDIDITVVLGLDFSP
jgi:polyisoprenyl-teichoic acid--peptidoglycan teichoic acid transferase